MKVLSAPIKGQLPKRVKVVGDNKVWYLGKDGLYRLYRGTQTPKPKALAELCERYGDLIVVEM